MSGREMLARWKAAHSKRTGGPGDFCFTCGVWPCDWSKALAALEEALAQIAQSKDAFSGVAVEAVLAKLGERSE